MGIPETVLSNPITALGVCSFTNAYNSGVRPTGVECNLPGVPQALGLISHKIHPSAVVPCESHHNPSLWRLEDQDTSVGLDIMKHVVQQTKNALIISLRRRVDPYILSHLIPSFPTADHWSQDTQTWYRRSEFWRKIVALQVKMDARGYTAWKTSKTCYYNRHFVVIPVRSKGNIVMSSDMVLMIKDITHSYLSASLHLDLVGDQNHLKASDLQFLEAWSGDVLQHMSNKAYSVIKGIESLCKGRIIQIVERVLDPDEVWNEMFNKIKVKERDHNIATGVKMNAKETDSSHINPDGYACPLSDLLGAHLQSIKDVDRVSEFFCLMKMAGHPQVDVRGGGRKSRDKGKVHPPIRSEDCRGIERSFCHVYTRGYIDHHAEWPPLLFLRSPDDPPSELEKLRDSDFRNLPLGLSMYPPSDWDRCVFMPHKSYDFDSDLLSLISDKSLSYLRTEYTHAWKRHLEFPTPTPTTERRVLTSLLRMTGFSLEEVSRIVQRREVPESWKIVTITPKEREMKEDPRMFAMMVFQMRTFFVGLEHNSATHIFPEIDEQTMTLSKQETVRRFFGLSNPGEKTMKAHIEIDFESWNLAWEKKTMSPIGCRQDQIFGEPGLYTYIHEFFEESLINVRVDGYIPDGITEGNQLHPPESDLIWYGHLGGFEGINQKLWTGATIGMIHWALWDLGIDYQISGQADNQVLTITVRFPESIRQEDKDTFTRNLVNKVKGRLRLKCSQVGQIIKEEECIQSTSYLSYSKDMWVDGRCLSTSMKSITRLFPTTSDDSPSLDEMISGLTSGGLSVAEKALDSGSAYWTTLALCSNLLHNELTESLLHGTALREELDYLDLPFKAKASVCLVLSNMPLILGGLTTPSWIEFMHRGVPDPLTSALTWAEILSPIPIISRWLMIILDPHSPWVELDPSIDRLILDPYSLPINRPSNPKLKAAAAVRDELLDITQNKDIRVMLHSGDSDSRTNLLEWLGAMKPLYPKVAHELYNLSPPGVVEKFSKRFTSTRTLLSVAAMSGIDVQRISIRADLKLMRWVLSALKTSALSSSMVLLPPWEPNMSYRRAVELRSKWGLGELLGVTTACSLDLGHLRSSPIGGLGPPSVVVATLDPGCRDPIHERGATAPYLGSATHVKTAYKGAKPVNSSPPVRDAIKILSIRNWTTQQGTKTWDDLTSIAQSRVSFSATLLEPFVDPVIGGTLIHRFSEGGSDAGAYLSCHPNVASNISLSSNAIGDLGERDYPVMIQSVLLTLISVICMSWTTYFSRQNQGIRLCYLLPSCKYLPLLEDRVIGDQDKRVPCLAPRVFTPYLMGDKLMIPGRSMRSSRYSSKEIHHTLTEIPEPSLQECLRHHLRQWIKRIPTPVQLGGRSWAEELPLKIIDIPEVYRVEENMFIDCLTSAAMDTIKLGRGYRESGTEWQARYETNLVDRLLKVSPGVLSTYNLVHKSESSLLIGQLHGIEGGIRLVSLCLGRWKELALQYHTTVFEKEPESLSSAVLVVMNRLITCLNMVDTKESLRSAKALGDVLKKIRFLAADEWDVQRRLWIMVGRINFLTRCLSSCNKLTGRVLRDLRQTTLESTPVVDHWVGLGIDEESVKKMVCQRCNKCKASGVEAVWRDVEVVMEWEETIRGWIKRPLSYLGSGFYNWLPLRVVSDPSLTFHIIGAGDATIDPVFHPRSRRVYYDTLSSTYRRGQGMVDPPIRGKSGQSSLSPLSWSSSIDITKEESLGTLAVYIKDLSVVIIDVDRVSLRERIKARDFLGSLLPGVMVLARFSGTIDEMEVLGRSICSTADKSTIWWKSPIHPSHELIAGNSSACPIAKMLPFDSEGCESVGEEIVEFKSPESWRAEKRYTQLSSSLALVRARLARRGLSREEERIQIVNAVL